MTTKSIASLTQEESNAIWQEASAAVDAVLEKYLADTPVYVLLFGDGVRYRSMITNCKPDWVSIGNWIQRAGFSISQDPNEQRVHLVVESDDGTMQSEDEAPEEAAQSGAEVPQLPEAAPQQ